MKKFLHAAFAALFLLTTLALPAAAQTQAPYYTRSAGRFIASRYNWGVGQVKSTNAVTAGVGTMILSASSVTLQDGSVLYPFTVPEQLMIDQGTSVAEIVTLTSASGCSTNAPNATCAITATFANAHGLPASEGDARKLESMMVDDEALGMWLTLLRMSAKVAATRREKLTWSHVIAAHAGLKQLEGQKF